MCVLRTGKSLLFLNDSQPFCSTRAAAVRQNESCWWARALLTNVGEWYVALSLDVLVCSAACGGSQSCAKASTKVPEPSMLLIAYSSESSFSGLWCFRVVLKLDIASATRCLAPTLCTTSESSLERFRRYRAICLSSVGDTEYSLESVMKNA